jgi:DNA-binding SARP family transcriptional activator/tetratricopeptide (TPR) repeat protein
VQFRVLGPVEVWADDGQVLSLPRRQERCLLGILLLEAGRIVSTDRLCELLWDDEPPPRARRSVQSYAARVRALLNRAGAGEYGVALVSRHGGYRLDVPPALVDVEQFRRSVDRAASTTDLSERDKLLREALALWHGLALQNAASDRLREQLCADLAELRRHAVEESLTTGLRMGRHHELLPELARLNAEHPTRERLVELHMLALYREGRTADALEVYFRARTRLAEELGRDPGPALRQLHEAVLRGDALPADDEVGAAPPAGTGVRPAQLPADLTGFAGRVEGLHSLDTLLCNASTAVVISAVAGTAGVGKTTLAVHWAHRVRHRFPDGQLYANLRGFAPGAAASEPGEVIRRFLDALGVPAKKIPADVDAQVGLYRSLLADKRVLVLLDNARDPDQVRPLLPAAAGCLALVTSRNRLTGLMTVDGARPIELDLLTAAEARQLLAARLGEDRVAAEPDAVAELIRLCARLPLALAVAAARVATGPRSSIAALVAELRDARHRLDVLTGDDTATDIRAVFSWTVRALSPAAARLFRLMGLHPGPDIAALAAASLAGIPVASVQPLLSELTRANLLSVAAPGRYAFHDLLRAYAGELAGVQEPAADRHEALRRMLDHYLHSAYPAAVLLDPHRDAIVLGPPAPGVVVEELTDNASALAWFVAEHQVLLGVVEQAANGFDWYACRLAWTLVDFFDLRGHWDDWIRTQQIAVRAAARTGDPGDQARAYRGLGYIHVRLGRLAEAETHLRQALDWYARLDNRSGEASVHLNLALVNERRERYPEALGHAQRALDLYRACGQVRGQAIALNSIGWFSAWSGDFQGALVHCRAALPLAQEAGDRREEAAIWDSLGYIHHHLGDHDEAVASYRNALDVYRDAAERFGEADTLRRLGDAYQSVGELDAADRTWREALRILDDLAHPDADEVRARLHDR